MYPGIVASFSLIILLNFPADCLHARQQEAEESISYATQHLDSRTASLDKYLNRTDCIQQRLLKTLRRKEEKPLRKLATKNPVLPDAGRFAIGLSPEHSAAADNLLIQVRQRLA